LVHDLLIWVTRGPACLTIQMGDTFLQTT